MVLLNYRKDGISFSNELSLSPVHGDCGVLTHFVGVQTDVTILSAVQAERDALIAAQKNIVDALQRALLLTVMPYPEPVRGYTRSTRCFPGTNRGAVLS